MERVHIQNAFVFELSKVETPEIRSRMVSHLLNIDENLAQNVAGGLGLPELPPPAEPARKPIKTLPESPALSIVKNGAQTFKGRKLGILATDGVDMKLLGALQNAVQAAGGTVELVAPKIGGVTCSDGMQMPARQQLNGGPSVLYDAVALLPSAEGAKFLGTQPAAKDFVNDAFAHAKFIAYVPEALTLLEKANLAAEIDEAFLELKTPGDAEAFITRCAALRFWAREEAAMKAAAAGGTGLS